MARTAETENGVAKGHPDRSFLERLPMRTRRLIWVWSFLALPILFYAAIRFYPTFNAFWLSFTNWDLVRPPKFIGLAN